MKVNICVGEVKKEVNHREDSYYENNKKRKLYKEGISLLGIHIYMCVCMYIEDREVHRASYLVAEK